MKFPTRRLWQIHSISSIYASGFIAFLCITGVMALFAPHALRWENRSAAYIEEAPDFSIGQMGVVLESAGQAAKEDSEGLILRSVDLPARPHHAVKVHYVDPAQQPKGITSTSPHFLRTYFVDPVDNQVTGSADAARGLDHWLRGIHVRFFAATLGRNLAGIFGLFMLISTISGLLIVAKFLKGKSLVKWKTGTLRNGSSDVHKFAGVSMIVFFLIFSITGTWLGLQGRLMQALDIERPESWSREAPITAVEDIKIMSDWNAIEGMVKAEFPDLIPQMIDFSFNGDRIVNIRGKIEGTVYERKVPRIILDKETLETLFLYDPRKAGFGDHLFLLQEPLHFGDFGGNITLIIWLIVGLIVTAAPITGLIVYLKRTKQNLRPFWIWTGVATAYVLYTLIFHKWLGLHPAMMLGTLTFFIFLLLLILVKTSIAIIMRARKKKASKILIE